MVAQLQQAGCTTLFLQMRPAQHFTTHCASELTVTSGMMHVGSNVSHLPDDDAVPPSFLL